MGAASVPDSPAIFSRDSLMPTFEDRLAHARPGGRTSALLMPAILAASLLAHGLLVGIAFVTARHLAPPQEEIPVEVVQEAPKPERKPEPKPEKKAEAKAEEAKPKPPTPEPAKPEPSKPEPSKPQAVAKTEPPPKPEPPKPEPPKAAPPTPEPPKAQAPDADARRLAELQRELTELRAQKDALAAEATAAPAGPKGPLAGSQLALALPGIGAGDGELVGYQDLVFSQLAKAKGDAEYRGKRKGTTGVTFDIDDKGALLDVAVTVPSGDPDLDRQALAIVRKAAPFPPPPKDGEHHFAANVNFIPASR